MSSGFSPLRNMQGSKNSPVNSSSMTFESKSSALHILDLLKTSVNQNDGRSFNFYLGALYCYKYYNNCNRTPYMHLDLLLLQKEFDNQEGRRLDNGQPQHPSRPAYDRSIRSEPTIRTTAYATASHTK